MSSAWIQSDIGSLFLTQEKNLELQTLLMLEAVKINLWARLAAIIY